MPRAAVVIGNAKRFHDEAIFFRNYLTEKVGLAQKDILFLLGGYLGGDAVINELKQFFDQTPCDDPVVVLYDGHGNTNGWHLDDAEIVRNEELAALFGSYSWPLVIVNFCCHSFALADGLKNIAGAEQRVLLLSPCAAEEVVCQGFVEKVCDAWRKKEAYTPPEILNENFKDLPDVTDEAANNGNTGFIVTGRRIIGKILDAVISCAAPVFRLEYKGEVNENWWECQFSRLLSFVTCGRYPVVAPYITIRVIELIAWAGVRIVTKPCVKSNPQRWGAALDHYFFPANKDRNIKRRLTSEL